MELTLGSPVACTDAAFGTLADVVIDPTTNRVTHLVVEREHENWVSRLVPIELAGDAGDGRMIAVRATVEEVRQMPPVHEVSYFRLDGFPVDDPDWDVGIEKVLAMPYTTSFELEPVPADFAVSYDRIPKHEVEIQRGSSVESVEGHHLGHVEGFLVDRDDLITHFVLAEGHAWRRRDVLVPLGAVERVENDAVTLRLSRDEVAALHEYTRA